MERMESRGLAGRTLPVTMLALLVVAAPGRAFADLTVFAGRATTISRTSGGAALGLSLQPLSLEFEFAIAPAQRSAGKPALQTGLFNLMVGTPSRTGRRIGVYGLVGGGMYRERFDEHAATGFAVGGGGGFYLRVVGPLRLRFDYRLFALRGGALHRRPERAYAGLSLAF